MKYVYFLCLFASILSCKSNNDLLPPPPEIFENSNLEVWVQTATDTGVVNVPEARVLLYESQSKRDQELDAAHAVSTDAGGKFRFRGLQLPAYWIVVSLPAPDGRLLRFHENEPYKTPGRTVQQNYLHVVFD